MPQAGLSMQSDLGPCLHMLQPPASRMHIRGMAMCMVVQRKAAQGVLSRSTHMPLVLLLL
jgi:hypothetical protein